MKIGILTYHACYNYGANLQAFALQQTLFQLGYDNEIIDYRNKDLQAVNKVLNYHIKNKYDVAFLIYNALHFFCVKRRKKHFEEFISSNLKCSELCATDTDVENICNKYDLIICGSDQIWNTKPDIKYNYPIYFLNFEKKCRRISYAASFGTNVRFYSEESEKKILEHLSKFDRLLVRESSAVEYLQKNGLQAQQTLDPTLLLEAKYYRALARPSTISKPYIVSLNWNGRQFVGSLAKKISKSLNIPLINPIVHPRNIFNNIPVKLDIGTSEFLDLIDNAEMVVTSSFHAVVFSILFHKPFVAVLNNTENKFTKTDDRLVGLLRNLGLEKNLVYSDACIDVQHILNTDFTQVDKKLNDLKAKSLNLLKEAVQNA